MRGEGKDVCSVVAPLFKSRRSLLSFFLSLFIFNISLQEEGEVTAGGPASAASPSTDNRPGKLRVLPDAHYVSAAVVGRERVLRHGERVLRHGEARPVALCRASHHLDAKSDLLRVRSRGRAVVVDEWGGHGGIG